MRRKIRTHALATVVLLAGVIGAAPLHPAHAQGQTLAQGPAPNPSPVADPAAPMTVAQLVQAMKRGGYILYMRHPQTHPDQADVDPTHLEDCTHQRLLTDHGREQARAIGAFLHAKAIPISRTITSLFCRTKEAASLMGYPAEASLDITEGGVLISPNENARRMAVLAGLLSHAPADGGNLLLIGHKPNIMDVAGGNLIDMAEGEMAVFEPQSGKPGFHLVARVRPGQWPPS